MTDLQGVQASMESMKGGYPRAVSFIAVVSVALLIRLAVGLHPYSGILT